MDKPSKLKTPSIGLLTLPNELLLKIAKFIKFQRDLSHLSLANRRLRVVLQDLLLERDIQFYKSSALLEAAQGNLVDLARRLVRLKAEIYLKPPKGTWWNGPLVQAVVREHVETVKILTREDVQQRYNVSKMVPRPLFLALQMKNEPIAAILIDRLDNPNMIIQIERQTKEEKTPLSLACENGLVDTTRHLLNKGADPNWRQENPQTGFSYVRSLFTLQKPWACQQRLNDTSLEILLLLFNRGLAPNGKLQSMGSKHGDPRVRRLFNRAASGPKNKPKDRGNRELEPSNNMVFPSSVDNFYHKTHCRNNSDCGTALEEAERRMQLFRLSRYVETEADVRSADQSLPVADCKHFSYASGLVLGQEDAKM